MALPLKLKQVQHFEWYTDLPYINWPRVSPSFIFQNAECYFKFTRVNSDYSIFMKQEKNPIELQPFRIKIYVTYDDRTLISFKDYFRVSNTENSIWSAYCSDFDDIKTTLHNGPFVKILFIFSYVSDLPFPTVKCGTDEKSVQTPPYLDARFSSQSLSQDLEKFMDTDSEHDTQFTCGNRTFKAHKSVLGTRSTVLKAMLQSDMAECKTGVVQIEEVESTIFEQFLRYVYTGNLPELTVETAKQLYEVGDKYSVEALKKDCVSYLLDNLSKDNACAVLVLADQHSDPEFRENVMIYILEEKLPTTCDNWKDFCGSYPKLATEALNRFCQSLMPK